MYVYRFNSRVRYQETDRMAIVYHTNYISWFDMGRTEFIRSLGYDYSKLEEEGIWMPVVEVGCKYKSPAKFDDIVTIETSIEELTRVKIRFKYRVFNGDVLLVEGFSVQGFTNDKLKPIAISKLKPDIYNSLEKCFE
jgi:acyl-CoA thioester hydrolase